MWKRENESSTPGGAPSEGASPMTARSESDAPSRGQGRSPDKTALSPSIVIRGDVSGDEDLLVEGRVEGKIQLPQNSVTIGAKGRASAQIHAHVIFIDGEVEGDLVAEEQIVLRKTSRVRGDLTAPRVTIEDGARFKGAIDMEPKARSGAAIPPAPTARPVEKPKETGGPRPVDSKSSAQAG
jgi:cytoskeletal protein CcmA (bactofilin family)